MPVVYKGDEHVSDSFGNRSYALFLRNDGSLLLAFASEGQAQLSINSPTGLIALNIWYHVTGIINARNGVMLPRCFIASIAGLVCEAIG